MDYSISNEQLRVVVNSLGAEPMSIRGIKDGLEYLWRGDPVYWARRSPTLFPIVGELQNECYVYNGREYKMERHGFTKTSEFEMVERKEDSLLFRLQANAETLKKYPFRFTLETGYQLKEKALVIIHRVVNTDEKRLWFSIGEHPGFRCPMLEGESMEDYSLVFDQVETLNRGFLENGLYSDREELFIENQSEIRLSNELFKDLAIIVKGFQSKTLTLKSEKHQHKVTVSIEGYPYLGIWSPETGAPFVCIEPWYGVSSRKNGEVDISKKEGIMSLEPGKEFVCSYRIEVE